MAVVTQEFEIQTTGFHDVRDITPVVVDFVKKLPFPEGSVTIFVPSQICRRPSKDSYRKQ